ncbi:MAG: hypothetical protein JWN67_2276 [Actinomycetia bacterium]|nr:hypothetical protein [Actinomycetes bacterium]
MSHACPVAQRTAHHYGVAVGPVRVVSAGLVLALVSVAACSEEPGRATDGRFCEVAEAGHVARLDLADPEVLADVRSELSRLRALAPASARHDLSRLLESEGGADPDLDDLQAAATRVQRYVMQVCG